MHRAENAVSADFVLIKDLLGTEIEQSRLLHDLGFRPIETDPNMVLALSPKWRSYDDYLAALSAKYRKNIHSRVLKPIDDAGITLERVEDVANIAPRLRALYLAVHENASLRPVTQSAGERARFSVLWREESLPGFIVTLREDAHTAIGYHIGFDREAAIELPLNLRLLQRTVEDSILLGASRVSLGRTALEPKTALGAKPEPLHVWVRHRRPVLNKLMRTLLDSIHHDDAPERNPFGAVAD